MKGFIVYPSYKTDNGKTYIQLFGRLENGQSFVAVNSFEPYFFIEEIYLKKAKSLLKDCKFEKTSDKTFSGHPVIKIIAPNQTELNKASKVLHDEDIDTYESDIKPHQRFMMDNDILGSIEIEGEHEPQEKIDRIYKEAKISPSTFKPELKVLSLDIESDKHSDKLFCIGLYSDKYKKNFFVSDKKIEAENTICCKTEEECLSKFKEELNKLDPDIITGWSIIDFDLKYLQERFKKHKIDFDIGRTNENISIRIESNFFKNSTADIPGRLVLDALSMIKDPFIKEAPTIKKAEFESFTLEDVSQEILGQGKLIKGKKRHEEIERIYKTDPKKLIEYNIQDCKLVYDILEKTKIIDLAIERSQLTGMPLDRITSSIASFDSLYIRESRKKGLVSPSTAYGQKESKLKGGYVFPAQPGVYKNVLVFDFKSLYPSVIKTFNIDPASFLQKQKKKDKDTIESPNKAYFKNKTGILPEIIGRLHEAREKAKKENKELSSYAIKTIMNSFWGVLASPNCRYFNFDMASAITSFARWTIQTTAKNLESKKYKVIYGDTDSIFLESNLAKDKANETGRAIQKEINDFYKNYVKEHFNRESFLEIQFQKQYLSFMIPQIRTSQEEDSEKAKAAKKRYAGLIEKDGKEEIEIVGLEAIRGDWTDAAQEFQKELLIRVFHNKPIEEFIREYIKKLNDGKMDEKLVYKKSIRKDLSEYTKTTPPHVKAARQLDKLDSNIIQYIITTEGPEPIQKIKHKIDYEHYIKKQIEPIANQILSLQGKTFDETAKKAKQTKLF